MNKINKGNNEGTLKCLH